MRVMVLPLLVVCCPAITAADENCSALRQRYFALRSAAEAHPSAAAYRAAAEALRPITDVLGCWNYKTDGNVMRTYNDLADRAFQLQRQEQEARAQRELERDAADRAAKIVADEKARTDAEARAQATRDDPKAMSIVFGAIFCHLQQVRRDALAEIVKEKKYARIGGIVDKSKLYALQLRLRWVDDTTSEQRQSLRTHRGVTPAPCTSARVQTVLACLDEAASCTDDNARFLATFVPAFSDEE